MKSKRILTIFCLVAACVFVLLKIDFIADKPTSFPDADFNNDMYHGNRMWIFNDTVFYTQDGFYNMGIYRSDKGNVVKLLESSDFEDADVGECYANGSGLYFRYIATPTDYIYRYDLEKETYAPVAEIPRIERWAVTGDYLIYRDQREENDEWVSSLFVHNMRDGTTKQVCPYVQEFGIVNGQLRYVTYSDCARLYQYDYEEGSSSLLGEFTLAFEDVNYNFTPDALVMTNHKRESGHELWVYTIGSDEVAVYSFPRKIQEMVAYDQYAYAVVYDTRTSGSDAVYNVENGIYRINLSDGSYEVVMHGADDDIEIHVTADDVVYIIEGSSSPIGRHQETVYRMDCNTGLKMKITDIEAILFDLPSIFP